MKMHDVVRQQVLQDVDRILEGKSDPHSVIHTLQRVLATVRETGGPAQSLIESVIFEEMTRQKFKIIAEPNDE